MISNAYRKDEGARGAESRLALLPISIVAIPGPDRQFESLLRLQWTVSRAVHLIAVLLRGAAHLQHSSARPWTRSMPEADSGERTVLKEV